MYHGGSLGTVWLSEESSHPSDPGTLLLFTDRCVSSSDTAFQYGHEEADHLRAPEPEPGGGETSHFNGSVIVA